MPVGFGGGFFDDDGNSTFDVEANAKSLDFMKRMDDADLLPKQPDAALATHLFNSNQAAMTTKVLGSYLQSPMV